MKIDNDASAPRMELDPRARLRHYVGAFRRRWYLVLVPLLLGTGLGWFSAPAAPAPAKKSKSGTATTVVSSPYFEATHVLIQESSAPSGSGNSSSSPVNLPQAAYLVNTGEVPVRTAQKLGLQASDVESRLIGLPRDQVGSIEVKAVGTDPAQVVSIADTAASELLAQLKAQSESSAGSERDKVVAQLDDLDRKVNDLNTQIAANPPNRPQLEAQQRSLSNQYSLVYEQFTNLANAPTPSAGLVSLEAASAKPISEDSYKSTLQTIRDGAAYVTGTQTTTPEPTTTVVKPTESTGPATRAALGGFTGLALGVGLVLLLDRFDPRLRRREDVEAASGFTVIAEIPRMKRKAQHSTDLQTLVHPRSRAAEAYRVVRGAIIYALSHMQPSASANGADNPAAVIMVTSADPGEGKTVTVSNLAEVFAEGGLEVLVINCDFRRPRVHTYLLEDPDAPTAGSDLTLPRPTKIPRVSLVTGFGEGSSETNPLEVVAEQQRVVDAQRGNFDVILLDTAPFLATNDASELLPRTDIVLVVVRSGKTTGESAHRTAEVLQRFSAPVLGVVFNASDETRGAQYYYYGYGYGEGGSGGDEIESTEARTPPTLPPPGPLPMPTPASTSTPSAKTTTASATTDTATVDPSEPLRLP